MIIMIIIIMIIIQTLRAFRRADLVAEWLGGQQAKNLRGEKPYRRSG